MDIRGNNIKVISEAAKWVMLRVSKVEADKIQAAYDSIEGDGEVAHRLDLWNTASMQNYEDVVKKVAEDNKLIDQVNIILYGDSHIE